MEHEFTAQIKHILASQFGDLEAEIFQKSPLLQYLNIKTRSAARGAKARSSFANLYAVYVLVEDYHRNGFDQKVGYVDYAGARFTDLLHRQRELPFGNRLQNHALNSRMNEEFRRYFPEIEFIPILRDLKTNRYWINENLLVINIGGKQHNIASALIEIIDLYVATKRSAFEQFLQTIERLKNLAGENDPTIENFILELLAPNADARIFEIVSYAILKSYFHNQVTYFGTTLENIHPENLKLYKTGRTNANDGGIDFVMRPLGRFFQVTETLDFRKYFLDIDKIERYPISFVIKSEADVEELTRRLREGAAKLYSVKAIVERYMDCIEEIINIPILKLYFREAAAKGFSKNILDEIVLQSRIEFNYEV
ncbi:MAG: restriction endonuclease [Chloroflexi bacterium]|nr:restriction endonuclease [Chloroflexota bacterium]